MSIIIAILLPLVFRFLIEHFLVLTFLVRRPLYTYLFSYPLFKNAMMTSLVYAKINRATRGNANRARLARNNLKKSNSSCQK